MKLHQAWILFVLSIGLGFSNPAEAASAPDTQDGSIGTLTTDRAPN